MNESWQVNEYRSFWLLDSILNMPSHNPSCKTNALYSGEDCSRHFRQDRGENKLFPIVLMCTIYSIAYN